MRASELLGLPVTDPDGRSLGQVLDVRLVQQGRLRGNRRALQVEGLVVGSRQLAAQLGYDRYEAIGPAPLRGLVRWLVRDNRFLPWHQVELTGRGVRARVRELERLRPL
jgi:sporulation protein YlmC with PRC-barrel domain